MSSQGESPGAWGREERMRLLESCGAEPDDVPALLAYLENPYGEDFRERLRQLPLADEPHLEVWRDYLAKARSEGTVAALRQALVQLRFPIRDGMAEDPAYRAATRKGVWPSEEGEVLGFEDSDAIELQIYPTMAGAVPILTCRKRGDFETMVRALLGRNQSIEVPEAMGACLVKGLVNWDRVRRYREAWEEGTPRSEAEWLTEFRRMAARKELYQDRVLLLSAGPYSAVDAPTLRRDPSIWKAESLVLRRDHECFHYLTLRLFGMIRSHLLDEVLADLAGLLAAHGSYSPDLALLFLGLEDPSEIRPDGRFGVYRPDPELGETGRSLLARITRRAIGNLQILMEERGRSELSEPLSRSRLFLTLAAMGLDGIASDRCVELYDAWRANAS